MSSIIFNKAYILLNSSYIEDDGSDYFTIIESDPHFYNKVRSRCEAKKKDDYIRAIHLFDDFIKLNPTHALSYHYMACTYIRLGEYEKALFNENKAIELNPENALFYNNLGAIYIQWKINSEALVNFTKSINLDPAFSIAYSNRAYSYFVAENFELAELDIKNALLLNPNNEIAYLIGSYIDLQKNKQHEALEKLNAAIAIDNKYKIAYKYRADLNGELNNYDEALTDYSSYIQLSSGFNADGYYDRGMAKFRHEDFAGAILDLARCMEISPTTECEYHLMSALQQKTDKSEDEITLFNFYQDMPYTSSAYNGIFDKGLNIEGEERFPLP
ncbi:MAG: tetratricopeptide repeat protein [Paludibacter sp.]|nr:tetratricopeptide repeat protein [Paludibacter sp.]